MITSRPRPLLSRLRLRTCRPRSSSSSVSSAMAAAPTGRHRSSAVSRARDRLGCRPRSRELPSSDRPREALSLESRTGDRSRSTAPGPRSLDRPRGSKELARLLGSFRRAEARPRSAKVGGEEGEVAKEEGEGESSVAAMKRPGVRVTGSISGVGTNFSGTPRPPYTSRDARDLAVTVDVPRPTKVESTDALRLPSVGTPTCWTVLPLVPDAISSSLGSPVVRCEKR